MNKNSIAIWLRANSYFVVTKKKYDDVMNTCHNLASITDQTGGWITLNLEGKLTKPLLEKLLTLDLDLFKKESAIRASINKINCLILCNKQSQSYTILCPASYFETMKKRLVNLTNLIA
jgi:heterotetrameric sarcosine oxidase gamma subunit